MSNYPVMSIKNRTLWTTKSAQLPLKIQHRDNVFSRSMIKHIHIEKWGQIKKMFQTIQFYYVHSKYDIGTNKINSLLRAPWWGLFPTTTKIYDTKPHTLLYVYFHKVKFIDNIWNLPFQGPQVGSSLHTHALIKRSRGNIHQSCRYYSSLTWTPNFRVIYPRKESDNCFKVNWN